MTWTYDTALAVARDQVRFYSGDTDSAAAITLSDEEIAGAVMLGGGTREAAALACEYLAARYSTVGRSLQDDLGQKNDYGERAAFYQARATLLRSRAVVTPMPFAGDLSSATKQTQEAYTDRVLPAFAIVGQ
jgi:hypothetical protein